MFNGMLEVVLASAFVIVCIFLSAFAVTFGMGLAFKTLGI